MPLPLVPLALAAGAAFLGYELFFAKKPGPAASTSCLPPQLQMQYTALLSKPDANPSDLMAIATTLDQYGCTQEAAALRARAAQLVGPAPAQPGPVPGLPQVQPPSPVVPGLPVPGLNVPVAPQPGAPATGLPLVEYVPDLSPTSNSSSYYYDASNGKHAAIDVRQDAKALRFLGYPAPTDPGGGNGMGADEAAAQGSWNPAMQTAVSDFQTDAQLTVDGWLGPNTRGALGNAVAAKNADNAAKNAAAGVPNAVFAGVVFGKVITPSSPRAATTLSALRLRSQPTPYGATVSTVPLGARARVIQSVTGPKLQGGPGPGGWSLVTYMGLRGWVPSEWLRLGS